MKMQKDSYSGDLTMSVPEAGALVGLNKNGSYKAAERGEMPLLWFGERMRVSRAAWLRKIDNPEAVAAQPTVAVLKQRKLT